MPKVTRFKFLCDIPVLRTPLPVRLLTAAASTVTSSAKKTNIIRNLTIVSIHNLALVSELTLSLDYIKMSYP
jgi:hypothetical protein